MHDLLGSDGKLAIGPCQATGLFGGTEADNPAWLNGGLEPNDRLVFDPSDSTLYAVNVQWSDQSHAYYIDGARAIVTLQGVHDLSASDLILYQHVNDLTTNFTTAAV